MEFGIKGASRVCRGRQGEVGIVEFGHYSADATVLALKQLASRDVTGSTLERHRRRHHERALFVDTEAQNVTVAPGDRAVLNCRVQQLGAKTVRRVSAAEPLTFSLSLRE